MAMKRTKQTRKTNNQKQEEEVAKVLAHFYKKSSKIVATAIKESHRKYPDLYKAS